MNTMVAVVAVVVAGNGTSAPPAGVDHNEVVALFEATARALGYEVDEAACTVPADGDVSVTCYGQIGDDVHIALVGLTDHGPTIAVYSTPDAVIGGDDIPTGQDSVAPEMLDYVVDGQAMAPALTDGQVALVDPTLDPERGHIIVFREVTVATERELIKRVVGLPGEAIEMTDCVVSINGHQLEEPYLDDSEIGRDVRCGGDFRPFTIPADHLFVIGDNRDGSQDSRAIGPIALDDVIGVVTHVRDVDGTVRPVE